MTEEINPRYSELSGDHEGKQTVTGEHVYFKYSTVSSLISTTPGGA